MKKVLLGLFVLGATSMAMEVKPTNVVVKAGVDVVSKTSVIKYDGQEITKKKTQGFKGELALEATQVITDEFEFGLGIAYQDHGKLKLNNVDPDESDTALKKLSSFPVYAIAKYNIPVEGVYKPFVYADLGYSFNKGKKHETDDLGVYSTTYKDGMYYGIGVGVERANFLVDLSYKINKGKVKYIADFEDGDHMNETLKLDYSRVALGFGYKFNF